MLSLLLFRSNPIHENTLSACVLVPGTHRYFLASLANVGYSSFLDYHQSRKFLSALISVPVAAVKKFIIKC